MQTKFDPKTLQLMAEASYKAQPPPSIGDWRLLVSTPTLKLYQNKGDYILAVRGTFDASDTKADTFIPLNLLASTDRYKADLKTVEGWKGAYGGDWYATGHSLGGAICDEFLRARIVKEAYTFNPAIQPKDFRLTTNKRFYAVGDPMWTLFGQYSTGATVVPPASILKGLTQSSNPLAAHGISSFDGVGDDVLKGGVKESDKEKAEDEVWKLRQAIGPEYSKTVKDASDVVKELRGLSWSAAERKKLEPLLHLMEERTEALRSDPRNDRSAGRIIGLSARIYSLVKSFRATPDPPRREVPPPPPKREETRGERVERMKIAFPPMQSKGKGMKGGISQFNYDAFMRESGASERMEFHSREFLPRSKRFLEAYSRSRQFMSEKERSDLDSLVEKLVPLVTRYDGKSYGPSQRGDGQIRYAFYPILSYVRHLKLKTTPNPSSSKIGRPHPLKPARPPPAPEPEPEPARPSRKLGEHVGALVKKIEGKGRKPTVGAKMKRDFLAAGHTEDEFKAAKRKYRKGGVDWKSLF